MRYIVTLLSIVSFSLALSFNDALKAYKDGLYTISYEKFYLLHLKDKNNSRVSLYLGKSLYQLGEYKKAVAVLSSIQKTDNKEISFYIGKCYFYLGEYKRAKSYLLAARDTKYNKKVDFYLKKIKILTDIDTFFVYLAMGATYNDNIHYNTYEPIVNYNGFILNNNTDKKSDIFIDKILYITHTRKIRKNSLYEWKNSLMIYDRSGIKYSNENITFAMFKSGPVFLKNGYGFEPKLVVSDMYYQSEHYMYEYGINFKIDKKFHKNLSTTLESTLKNRKYIQDKDREKDALVFDLSTKFSHPLSPNGTVGYKIGYTGIEKRGGNRIDISKDEYMLLLSFNKRVSFLKLYLSSRISYKNIKYRDIDKILGYRKDNRYAASISIRKSYKNIADISLRYTYIKNRSNFSPYSYKVNRLTLMVSKSF